MPEDSRSLDATQMIMGMSTVSAFVCVEGVEGGGGGGAGRVSLLNCFIPF